jgi:2,3-bisphosphoglycerate-independent phosphoglycerate mutase
MDTAPLASPPKPVVLCILDGWGFRPEKQDNALAQARTPVWQRFMASSPHALVATSGEDVGLPHGQMGNSEVGHMNIGAGRILTQELPRIDAAVADGSIGQNPALRGLIDALKASGGVCHLLGLISPGGVHSHQDHIVALARVLDNAGVGVRIHAFLDGRDTPPQSASGFMEKFLADLAHTRDVSVATVGGRYYGMDRDKRWDRVEKAYEAIVNGIGVRAENPSDAIKASYAASVTDEFMVPAVIGRYAGMADGDGVLCGNFRADRVRQILSALLDPAFTGFAPSRRVKVAAAIGLTEYSAGLSKLMGVMFAPAVTTNMLGEIISRAGLKQLRIAETEKYAHVTFFFNGGVETEFPGETRILIPSPKVATYDLQPEMSAPEVTDKIVDAIDNRRFDVIIVNYANGDMVGHTGILQAAVKAAEAIDTALGRLEEALQKAGGVMIVTADHGNLEMMRDPQTGEPHTQHTLFRVPVVLVNGPADVDALADGRLADIAPTVLDLLGLKQPPEMTGHSLLHHGHAAQAESRHARARA